MIHLPRLNIVALLQICRLCICEAQAAGTATGSKSVGASGRAAKAKGNSGLPYRNCPRAHTRAIPPNPEAPNAIPSAASPARWETRAASHKLKSDIGSARCGANAAQKSPREPSRARRNPSKGGESRASRAHEVKRLHRPRLQGMSFAPGRFPGSGFRL